jgi:Ca2+-binding RTX toxin-like protein
MTNEVGHSVTFNAVGIGQILDGVNPSTYDDSIMDYVNQNDIIGQYGVQLGQTTYQTDTGNYQYNSSEDNTQLALQLAAIQAMQQGNLTQAAGTAILNALSEAAQGALNANSDVFFGAHGLDAMISPNGEMSQTVTDPNMAIAALTQVINGFFTVTGYVVGGINHFAVEIIPAIGEAAMKVDLAILEGGYQVVTTIGEAIYDWVIDIVGGTTGTIQGGLGSNMYVFAPGDGQVAVLESGGLDTIKFSMGINPDDVTFKRVERGYTEYGFSYTAQDLEISINGTNDKITIQHYFDQNEFLDYKIERIAFADGTVWTQDTLYDKMHNLVGSAENDNLAGYDSSALLDNGAFTLRGLGGDDVLSGKDGNDTLTGGTGNDYLMGSGGGDTYVFALGDGQDTIYEDTGVDTVQFGAGIDPADVTVKRVIDENNFFNLELSIAGTNDKITVTGYFGLADSSGNYGIHDTPERMIENITFADGTTWTQDTIDDFVHNLAGTAENDTLDGFGTGAFTFRGLAGDDTINGGYGDDTYIFATGDGQDTIFEGSGTDIIQFAAGINPNDVIAKRIERYTNNFTVYDLELSIAGTNDKITIQQFFGYSGYNGLEASPNQVVEQITFADGTVWTPSTIDDKVHNLVGTAEDDWISAYDQADVHYLGLAGNDYLSGNYGNDVLDGGEGADYLSGDSGDDTLLGGAGDDSFNGGDGNDVLNGGIGNDTSYDSGGNDTYIFALGDGQDTIYDYTGTDSIQFDPSVSPEDMIVKRVSRDGAGYYDLELSILNTNDSLTIQNYFGFEGSDGPQTSEENMIEQFTFADGTIWTTSTIYDKVDNVSSTSGDDFIFTYDNGAVTLSGLAGNDTLVGNNGNDVLQGDAGTDLLSGGSGDDTLDGGADNDRVFGGEGNDSLVGGTGNDELRGGLGDDYYVFALGDGQDTIYETDGMDTIQFGAGIDPADVTVRRIVIGSGYQFDLELGIIGTNDKLTISSHFGGSEWGVDYATPGQEIEKIVFADGTIWDSTTILDKAHDLAGTTGDDSLFAFGSDPLTLHGLAGNDYIGGSIDSDTLYGDADNDTLVGNNGDDSLYGNTGDDTLNGGNGSDILYGGSSSNSSLDDDLIGNDILTGGADNDSLYGGYGNDLYVFGYGDGQDTIDDFGGSDQAQLNRDLLSVIFERVGDDLRVVMNGSTDSVTVSSWYGNTNNQVETFDAYGSTISNTQIEQLIQAMASFSTDNGMSWSEALDNQSATAQSVISQYWTAPTV